MGHSRAIFGSLGRLFLAFALGTAAACGTSDGTLSDGRQSPGDAHGNDARGADALINADAVVLDGPLNDVDAQLPIDAPASAIDAHVFIDAGPPPAQLTWTPVSAATPPTAAYSVSVYDSARNRVVNFDGADTTVWNGSTWVSLLPPTSPSDNTRSQFAMGYDPVRDRIVLFGGIGSDVHGDTWEFDGETWAQAAPATSPNARWDAGFVFDGATDRSLVFGGSTFIAIDSGNAQVAINDGWEYDGATWTQVTAVGDVMPSNLSGSGNVNAVAYDSLRNQVIEFGGDFSSGNDAPGQTWAFDGTQWTQLSPDNSPPERSPCRLVYDSARDRVVLFGGGFGNPYPDDVWEFDGTTWTEATPTPSPTPRSF